jgi:Calcineurin-like phosphoesterase
MHYDIIGDVHGHAAALEALLATMGYVKRDGVWKHPERIAAFVGDYVDRGPENMRACRIVMAMEEAGSCVALMGNHDFNAVCLNTPDPANPESFLRPHTQRNLERTAETRADMDRDLEQARLVLKWLRRLPLWLDLDRLRIVHAEWSPTAMTALLPWLDEDGALTDEGLVRAARKGDRVQQAREILLNGLETRLPSDQHFRDKDGDERSEVRLAWWRAGDPALTWRDGAYVEDHVRAKLPEALLPAGLLDEFDDDPRPIVFGHYWMKWPLELLTPRHACVDASVADGGRLAAYRFNGEYELVPDRFVSVGAGSRFE